MNRYHHLDVWRGAAILCVLFGHFVTSGGLNLGRFGVELFFALSGLLVGQILFTKTSPIKDYIINRTTRIIPSLTAFCIAALLISNHTNSGINPKLGWLLIWTPPFKDMPTEMQHLWSIAIELQGYLLLAVIAIIARHSRIQPHFIIYPLCLLFIIITFLKVKEGNSNYYEVFWSFESRSLAMLLGAAFASKTPEIIKKTPYSLLLITAILLSFNVIPDIIKYTAGSFFVAACCASCHNSFQGGKRKISMSPLNKLFIYFGTASYSIYLWQQLFYANIDSLSKPIALLTSIIVGFIWHYRFDQHLHSYTRRKARILFNIEKKL